MKIKLIEYWRVDNTNHSHLGIHINEHSPSWEIGKERYKSFNDAIAYLKSYKINNNIQHRITLVTVEFYKGRKVVTEEYFNYGQVS